jgi:hypothetical protein
MAVIVRRCNKNKIIYKNRYAWETLLSVTYWSLSGTSASVNTLVIDGGDENGISSQLDLGCRTAAVVTILEKNWWLALNACVESGGLDLARKREDLTAGGAVLSALAVRGDTANVITE